MSSVISNLSSVNIGHGVICWIEIQRCSYLIGEQLLLMKP
jgi:hypothetical protein